MVPNVDLNNNNSNSGDGINSPSQQQEQQQKNRRCFRLRQLKKILPSDHVTIEKNFPRFYEKCKNLKLQLRDFQDRQDDHNRRFSHPLMVNNRSRQHSTTVETTESARGDQDDIFKLGASGTKTNKMAAATLEIKMADHLDDMTLHRGGCWLQAKCTSPCRKTQSLVVEQVDEAPRVVFLHRKQSPTEIRPRCQLAREVLAEFEREKRKLQSKSSFFAWKLNYDHLCRRVS